jgi:hypothetical protein
MTLDSLCRLVAEMRAAQREFFRTKSASNLRASKALEKRVDLALADHFDRPPACLFPEEHADGDALAMLARLWNEVKRYDIGFEGSELLEVMTYARILLDEKGVHHS